jgi:hypothetical protein
LEVKERLERQRIHGTISVGARESERPGSARTRPILKIEIDPVVMVEASHGRCTEHRAIMIDDRNAQRALVPTSAVGVLEECEMGAAVLEVHRCPQPEDGWQAEAGRTTGRLTVRPDAP